MTRTLKFAMDEIPFKQKFSHASFEREASTTLWVSLKSHLSHGLGEACPRPYVTGETPETVQKFFLDSRADLFANTTNYEDFVALLEKERAWIDQNPSAFCALELAWWDLFAKSKDVSIDKVFGERSLGFKTPNTMVVGLGTSGKMLKTYLRGLALGFKDFKIKISPDSQKEVLLFLNHSLFKASRIFKPKIRIDANNSFANFADLQKVLDLIPHQVWAVEEPFAVENREAREEFLQKSKSLLILDESLVKLSDLKAYEHAPLRICLNVRISKLGGLLRTQEIVDYAQKNGIRWGLGCQVGETSLLARAGLLILDKNEHRPLFWEGAFSDHLLTQDPFMPKLKVGPWGLLIGQSQIQGSGWGIFPASEYFKKLGVLS
ncbi:enolase C-terminal domain-like protein [Bdellovibrio sp. HCB337]|uniref:enolase C-terminal domain-like protein n=1 Tax=Bdellovibrio sp. HCB337 TaxID=3394358 RepID=UPI0039A42F09